MLHGLNAGINMAVKPTRLKQPARQKQSDKSDAMRRLLIDATISSLVDVGYKNTTAVEVCRRAGVTRGALFHHFESLAVLLAETMSSIYDRNFFSEKDAGVAPSPDQWVDLVWAKLKKPEFKAVIEVWFAARNEPDMAEILRPSILKYVGIFSVAGKASSKSRQAFYRLARETMLGLALGRATTPAGAALPHEASVIGMLKAMAKTLV